MEGDIRATTKYSLPQSIKNRVEDNYRYFNTLPHEELCAPLSTLELRDARKSAVLQIKRLFRQRSVPEYYIRDILRVPHKNKLSTGVLHTHNPIIKAPNYGGNHIHCILCKKAAMPDTKYIPHSFEVCFGKKF